MTGATFFIAWRYLRSKKGGAGFVSLMSIFSFIGIALGVATLIIVLAVMTGFREKLLSKILDFNCHASLFVEGSSIPAYDLVIQKIKTVPDVLTAVPIIEDQGMMTSNGKSSGVMVRGMRFEDMVHKSGIARHLTAGSLDAFQNPDESPILVGKTLAGRLGLKLGSQVSVLCSQGAQTPFGLAPRQKTFTVSGIFDVGMSEYNANFVFIPLEIAQALFKLSDRVSSIEVNFVDPHTIKASVNTLNKTLLYPGLVFMDWQKRHSSFFEAILVQRNVMFIVLTLIILIAAFNIVSGLIMLVQEKTKAIGILRAIGLTQRGVMGLFFLIGSFIGVSATLFGTILGLLFCANIDTIRLFLENLSGTHLFSAEVYYLSQLPAVVDIHDVWTIGIISLTLTFLATLYPAYRASSLKPVEALRYDG